MYVRAAVGAVVDGAGVLAVDRVVEAVLVQHDLAVQCLAGGDLLAQLHGVQYARAGLLGFEAEDLRYGAAAVVGADGEHVGTVFLLCSELLADAEGAVVFATERNVAVVTILLRQCTGPLHGEVESVLVASGVVRQRAEQHGFVVALVVHDGCAGQVGHVRCDGGVGGQHAVGTLAGLNLDAGVEGVTDYPVGVGAHEALHAQCLVLFVGGAAVDFPDDDCLAEAGEGAYVLFAHGALGSAGRLLVVGYADGVHVFVACHCGNLVDGVAAVEVAPGGAACGVGKLQVAGGGLEAAAAVTVHLDDGAALQAAFGDELDEACLCGAVLRFEEQYDLLAADGGVFAACGYGVNRGDGFFEGGDVVQVGLFAQVLAHVDLVLAQFGEGVAANVHGRTGGALDVGVVHADELAVAGGAYGNFDGEGAAAYGLCVGVGGVLGADVAGTAVGDEEFIGLVEQLMCGGAAVYCRELCAGAGCGVGFACLEHEGGGCQCGGADEAAAAQILRGLRECSHRSSPFSFMS